MSSICFRNSCRHFDDAFCVLFCFVLQCAGYGVDDYLDVINDRKLIAGKAEFAAALATNNLGFFDKHPKSILRQIRATTSRHTRNQTIFTTVKEYLDLSSLDSTIRTQPNSPCQLRLYPPKPV